MKIFDLDGPFQKYGTMVFDILLVNTLWLLLTIFSFGILAGPALTGGYAGLYTSVVSQEGYVMKQFFKRAKKRFLLSLLIGIGSNLLIAVSLFNIYAVLTDMFGTVWLLPVYMFVFIEIGFTTTYIYPMLAHTDLAFKDIVRSAFFLANKHLPTSLLAAILNLGVIYIIVSVAMLDVSMFILLFAVQGVVTAIISHLISKRILSTYDFFVGLDD